MKDKNYLTDFALGSEDHLPIIGVKNDKFTFSANQSI